MARSLRFVFPGGLLHITSRRNAHLPIFENGRDRELFLTILHKLGTRLNWLCHAYCLMDNYYLLLEILDGYLSRVWDTSTGFTRRLQPPT